MTERIPKFPDSLPPPVEVVEGPRYINFMPDELKPTTAIADLVHDLYCHHDNHYFLFFVYGEGIGADLKERLKSHGVAMKKTELYFYRHPKPAYKSDLIRVLPHSGEFEWQKEAAKGQMYGRVFLSLEPWRRKQLDLEYAARATTRAIADAEPVVEMKPNFAGMGINMHSVFLRLKRWWSGRRLRARGRGRVG